MLLTLRALLTLTFLPLCVCTVLVECVCVCTRYLDHRALSYLCAASGVASYYKQYPPNGKVSQLFLVLFVRPWWFSVAPRNACTACTPTECTFQVNLRFLVSATKSVQQAFFAHSDVFPWRKNELPLSFRHRPTPCAVLPLFRIDRFPLMTSFASCLARMKSRKRCTNFVCFLLSVSLCKT